MKKILFLLTLLITVMGAANAQTLRVHNSGNIMYAKVVSAIDSLTFDNTYAKFYISGSTSPVNIQKRFIDSITFTTGSVTLDKVYVLYNGTDNPTIINPYAAQGITLAASGSAVSGAAMSGISNIQYHLLGTAAAGSLTLSSTSPATFVMNNLALTNASGCAIQITGGQVHTFVSQAGTSNSLTDGSGNTKNGTLQTNGKIILAGTGAFAIKGVAKHGISTSGFIEVQSSAITITSAASDGLHSEGFIMSGGTVTVAASSGDGIDAGDAAVTVTGGTINVTSTAADVKAFKTGNGTISISGGTFNLNVAGGASKAIAAKGAITISAGTFAINLTGAAVLTASGSGYDPSYCTGVKSDGQILLNGGAFTITTTTAATGAKAFSATGGITVTDGTYNITTAGNGATYVNTSGVANSYSTTAFSTDAAINVSGGNFMLVNTGNDGKQFSSDGAITVTGGTINSTNSGAAGKAFKADGTATFSGGNTTISLSGAVVLAASGSGYDPSYSTGIKATGIITVNTGATITISGTSAAAGAKGLSSANGIVINGGTIGVALAGAGANYTNATGVADSYSAAGLSCDADITLAGGAITLTNTGYDGKNVNADANIIVSGGTINLTNSGNAGRGYNADDNITFNGGSSTINLSGAAVLATSGNGYDPSYPAGIKADRTVTVNTGATVFITGTSAATGARGLSGDTAINITGGTITITLAGNGANYTNASGASDSYAAAAFSSDAAISITGGSVTTSSSGTGGKGLKSDGTITIGSATGSPTLTITTTGARFIQSGSGTTADYNHPKTIVATRAVKIINGAITIASTDDGIHSDDSVSISGGNTKITATSATSGVGEGVEAPVINISGGVTNVTASNDGLNGTYGTVSGGIESNDGSQINIAGGILIVAGSDAIDANGNLTISGGTTIVCGPTNNPEEGIDFNGTFNMNGGLLISAGSNASMTKAMSTTSTQVSMYLKSSAQLAATSLLHIENAAGTEMVTFKPKNGVYYFHFSSSALARSTQYKVYFGGSYSTTTYTGGSSGWGLCTGGTWSSGGATLKSTFTTSASANVNTVTF